MLRKTVVVIGGGPAGMSCALWLQNFNFNPVLIERSDVLGGLQRMNASRNKWFLGHPSITGHEMSETFQRNLRLENIPVCLSTEVTNIQQCQEGFRVFTKTATTQGVIRAVAIVIATGTSVKGAEAFANVPGINETINKKLLSFTPPGTNELLKFSDKRVAVIGGGDNALETVLNLVRVTHHIDLIVRSQLRAQGWMQEKLYQHVQAGDVSIHRLASLQSCQVKEEHLQLTLLLAGHEIKELTAHHIVARTGFTPSNPLLDGIFSSLERDHQGYLKTNPNSMQTSMEGIYAVGDVCNATNPCVATAVAHGTIAARNIEQHYRSEPITQLARFVAEHSKKSSPLALERSN